MLKFWGSKKAEPESSPEPGELTWSAEATQGLNQALSQAPVPTLLKNRLSGELKRAAETAARKAGHTEVTAQDLMTGLLDKMPPAMREKIESALKSGPSGLAKLQKDLQDEAQN